MSKEKDPFHFEIEGNENQKISEIVRGASGFEVIDPIFAKTMIGYRYYSFKVPKGSCYISLYTTQKVKDKETGREIYAAILLRRYQKGGYKGPIEWKVAKTATRIRKWKCIELARKWRAQKLGVEFIPRERPKRKMGEERRAELANRMLDCAGHMHNLPVFDLNFECSACGHNWSEVTYESGTAECPECSFTETY